MTKNFKIIRSCCAIIVTSFLLVRLYYTLTDDFRVSNISHLMPYEKNWEIEPLLPADQDSINTILKQPFYYLGKGSQSYAFVSENDQYVLKFFKFKHLRPSWFVDLLPPIWPLKQYKAKQDARKLRKLFGVFNSYKLAYDRNREESGLLFIQLNQLGNLPRQMTIIDKLGITNTIDVSEIPFILQNKGIVLREVLNRLLSLGDVLKAQKRIAQIIDLYAYEYRKGIYDHDHGVMRNIGFIDETPIHLDVGKLLVNENIKQREPAKADIHLVADKIKEWVGRQHPQYHTQLSDFIDQKIVHVFGE